jgi:hypothetical protein
MQTTKEKVSFYLTAFTYFLFNFKPADGLPKTIGETLMQILQTAPYVAGVTWVLIAFLQYMSEGKKMPWERRFRLFFTIGIIVGFYLAIYEHVTRGHL